MSTANAGANPPQPYHLEPEEIKNPHLVIHRFFDYANIHQQRRHLWDWLRTTVSGSYCSPQLARDQRSDMLYFYEHLQRLIEAAHLIHLQQKTNKAVEAKRSRG